LTILYIHFILKKSGSTTHFSLYNTLTNTVNNQEPDPIVEKAITFAAGRGMFQSHSPHSDRNWLTVMKAAVDSLIENVDLPVDDQQWWDILCKYFEQFENCIIEDYGENMPECLREGLKDSSLHFVRVTKLPIQVLGLPTRAEHALRRARITRVHNLVIQHQCEDQLLCYTEGFGEKSLEAVDEALTRCRLTRGQLFQRAREMLQPEGERSELEQEAMEELRGLIVPRHETRT
jgi:hypothetical protein